MADEEDDLAALVAVSYSGPAPYVNRFHVRTYGTNVRIGFAEQYDPNQTPVFRTAITLEHAAAYELATVLNREIEAMYPPHVFPRGNAAVRRGAWSRWWNRLRAGLSPRPLDR